MSTDRNKIRDAEQAQLSEIRPGWRALPDQVAGLPAGSLGPGAVAGGGNFSKSS